MCASLDISGGCENRPVLHDNHRSSRRDLLYFPGHWSRVLRFDVFMKKFLLVTSAIVAAGPAFAADLPLRAPPMAVPATWTGCHVGGHIGAATDRSQYSDP